MVLIGVTTLVSYRILLIIIIHRCYVGVTVELTLSSILTVSIERAAN